MSYLDLTTGRAEIPDHIQGHPIPKSSIDFMIRVYNKSSYAGNNIFIQQNRQHFSSICLRYLKPNKHIKNLRKGYFHPYSCLYHSQTLNSLVFPEHSTFLYHPIAFCLTNIPLHCMHLGPKYIHSDIWESTHHYSLQIRFYSL